MLAPFIIMSMFMVFGLSALAVVLMLVRRRPKSVAADDSIVQLRDEMRELRDSMESRFAAITLMLDDMDKRQLPPGAGGD